MATRLAGWREEDGRLVLDLQPVALGAAPGRGRRLRQPDGAVRRARPRTAAGWPVAARPGSRPGRTAGRSAPAARWTSARARPRRSRASCARSGSSSPSGSASRRCVGLPNGVAMVVGLATVADGAEPVPDHEHDEWAWWPADVGRVAGRGRRPPAADGPAARRKPLRHPGAHAPGPPRSVGQLRRRQGRPGSDARAAEPAVAVRVLREVLLVVVLGVVELRARPGSPW